MTRGRALPIAVLDAERRTVSRPGAAVLQRAVLLALLACGALAHAEVVLKPAPPPAATSTEPGAAATAPLGDAPVAKKLSARMRQQLAALSRQADAGDVAAMLRLGWIYHNGEDVARSDGEAYRRFRQAADLGDLRAMMAAGFLLAKGWGVARDPNRARSYFDIAQQVGYARAFYLQSLLEDDIGGARATQAARDLLERAASAGDPIAANALGVTYERNGQAATARLWYQQAAARGSRASTRNLAHLDESAQAALQRGDSLQRQRADSAAGDAGATYALAGHYHRGDGVQVDYGEAVRLYRLAAHQGSAPAQRMLSLILSRSTPAEPISSAWMLELSHMALPQNDGALPDAAGYDEALDGLLDLKPQIPAGGTAAPAPPQQHASALADPQLTIGAGASVAPSAGTTPAAQPPANADALQRARGLRDRGSHLPD
ncbi:SEL1-like repeat protein [Dokdonella soli]|uniref:Sel1 repeat family protein n=1 Tax=Dokdonella soli TaxID=529810 RepID=A0ABP3U5J1_9GAMM